MTRPGQADRPADGSALSDLAQQWASALAWTSYVPMNRAERHATLVGFAERLAGAIVAEPFSEQLGHDVGIELVAADFAAPEALGATVQIIDERLLAAIGMDPISGQGSATSTASNANPPCLTMAEARARLARLLGALATGYSWTLRDRTLDEQEAIRVAALVAREHAEEALRASEARFRYAAYHDLLTDMPNRAFFADRLDEIFRTAAPTARIALCFIDLDAFKAVNDSLGHQIGDKLLVAVARRLTLLAQETGQVAARFGGDEFVFLIEGSDGTENAVKVADLIMAVLSEPFHVEGHDLPMAASIGIVERSMGETDATDLVRAADMTLHWAKADGKARWCIFDTERNAREVARYSLAAAMPAGLDRDEFTLVYQPIVGLARGTLDGVEALARWEHPELGLLNPDRFIDLAEDSGLIVPLGLRLMEQACRQAAHWLAIDPQCPFVSVNLAVRQIRHPHFVADVAAVLDRTGLPPHLLQLEITESAVMGDDPETLKSLRDLSGIGVRLAVDDFGTGYSNLAYLRTLPLRGLKLAGQFMDDLNKPQQSVLPPENALPHPSPEAAFLQVLVSLGHTLGLTVTAEGVETADQAEVLRAIGCESGQGYYLGHPTAPGKITELLGHSTRAGRVGNSTPLR
ncbi:MAG: diguanylate cyclase [Micromonosporaceae bacterium]|nr:diguanylate cyclase [Micromonosporaceae bacterium]